MLYLFLSETHKGQFTLLCIITSHCLCKHDVLHFLAVAVRSSLASFAASRTTQANFNQLKPVSKSAWGNISPSQEFLLK